MVTMRIVYEEKNFFGDRELRDITSFTATLADVKKGFALLKRQPATALWFVVDDEWVGYMYDSRMDSEIERMAVRRGNGEVKHRPLSLVKAELYKKLK